jgi:hypothetical protein
MAVHALKTELTELTELTDEAILERIRGYVEKGWSPYIAAERVIADIRSEGRERELIESVVPLIFLTLWESSAGLRRPAITGDRDREAQNRRVSLAALSDTRSLLEAIHKVDGRWVRIGDMDRATCRAAARSLKREALATAQRARFFHALAERLSDDARKVREVIDNPGLAALYDEQAIR